MSRGKPTYGLEVVGEELPAQDTRRRGGKKYTYVTLLTPIAEDAKLWGLWFKVAEYSTSNGGNLAVKAIGAGDLPVPQGRWEFDVRRFNRESDGKRVSALYAKRVADKADMTDTTDN